MTTPPCWRLLTPTLADTGYGVPEASNGRQALELMTQDNGIDLFICDLVMPEREGVETIRAIHRDHPELPVIAISGAFGAELLGTATRLGVQATLRKPIRRDAEMNPKLLKRSSALPQQMIDGVQEVDRGIRLRKCGRRPEQLGGFQQRPLHKPRSHENAQAWHGGAQPLQ